jgi:uncharacterized lipoprotein YmbA
MRTRHVVIAGALVLGLAGCVSLKRTPEARFFVLRSLVEPPAASAPAALRPGSLVGLLPVRLPGHLERPQVVTWAGPGELRIDEYLRWAEPLDAGVTRTLAENLDSLLADHPVIRSPWRGGVTPFCRVVVDLRVFGVEASGEARLEGRWALFPGKGERPLVRRSTSLRQPVGPGPVDAGAGVEAMSALLADLAREIASAVESLPAEPAEK